MAMTSELNKIDYLLKIHVYAEKLYVFVNVKQTCLKDICESINDSKYWWKPKKYLQCLWQLSEICCWVNEAMKKGLELIKKMSNVE